MRMLLLLAMLAVAVPVYPVAAQGSCTLVGSSVFCSDGSSGAVVGNTMYFWGGEQGRSLQRVPLADFGNLGFGAGLLAGTEANTRRDLADTERRRIELMERELRLWQGELEAHEASYEWQRMFDAMPPGPEAEKLSRKLYDEARAAGLSHDKAAEAAALVLEQGRAQGQLRMLETLPKD